MSGLQCWDANGRLIVDIGDYNCRYIGSVNVTMGVGVTVLDTAYAGLTRTGSFATIGHTDTGTFFAVAYDGGFRVIFPGAKNFSQTLTVYLYGFL